MATTYQVTAPQPFNFTKPEEWEKWLRQFERFRGASGLSAKEDEAQVNTLIYTMGAEADDIFRSFKLSEDDSRSYKTVSEKFTSHFVKKHNVIYERARFNMRRQEEGEPVDAFVTDLYSLAEHCDFNDLHDQLIRDRIVVGIRDSKLSEKLQLDSELTLEKAITRVRQSETVHAQQTVLRGDESKESKSGPIGGVHAQKKHPASTKKAPLKKSNCSRCGRQHPPEGRCPAREAVCRKCKKRGHFQAVCRTAKVAGIHDDREEAFLGVINDDSSDSWNITLSLNNKLVDFCIDTGAEVTVVPETVYELLGRPQPIPIDRQLKGPSSNSLRVKCQFIGTFQKGNLTVDQSVYVVENLHKPLLGRPTIEALKLLTRIGSVDKQSPISRFQHLFEGLGRLKEPYTIKLMEDAKPYTLFTPRRVPIPLMEAVKNELERMERIGVIARVNQPTEWCAGMVPVPKKDGRVRICVDLTQLNKCVQRERHQLPAVEQVLAQLTGAKVFSKLDANSGFWQIPLAPESALLTTFITPFGRYCFHRLPFGITSAPEHFNRRISDILSGAEGVVSMTDDILVFGRNQSEHDTSV